MRAATLNSILRQTLYTKRHASYAKWSNILSINSEIVTFVIHDDVIPFYRDDLSSLQLIHEYTSFILVHNEKLNVVQQKNPPEKHLRLSLQILKVLPTASDDGQVHTLSDVGQDEASDSLTE